MRIRTLTMGVVGVAAASAYACGQSGGAPGGAGSSEAGADGTTVTDAPGGNDSPNDSRVDSPTEVDGGCSAYTGALAQQLAAAKQKIQHVVVIMQENRSFDHYFGTYPGADGIPMDDAGNPTVCIPNSLTTDAGCTAPFHDIQMINSGGPHDSNASLKDVNGGLMNGFIAEQGKGKACDGGADPLCTPDGGGLHDAVGYHTRAEIPNYWAYADNFVLQDKLFEPIASYSMPSHMFLVSAWSAICTEAGDASSCAPAINPPASPPEPPGQPQHYAWTDLTWLLHKHGVPWKYYLAEGAEPDCDQGQETCAPVALPDSGVNSFWNPLPAFETVVNEDKELGNVVPIDEFLVDAKNGTLPPVSWIVPQKVVSEHPPAAVNTGEAYVTSLVNAVMQRPALWASTVIFIAWDDWGGFYDHVPPVAIDQLGYGIRVPGLTLSPYARHFVDHQVLSFDGYIKLIEDLYMGGERLDPRADGRPDPRQTVRECVIPGNFLDEFDFTQAPRAPLVLTPQ